MDVCAAYICYAKVKLVRFTKILNSDVFWRFIQLTTPQMGCTKQVLRLAELKRFPIPRPNTEEQKTLMMLIKNLAQQAMNCQEISEYQKQIDGLVQILYETADCSSANYS
jgi:hypothetical protein